MTISELRKKYLAFFESKGHSPFPSGPLVPYDVTGRLDESLLFNGAGMVQFKPYFRGIAEPPNKRLTTAQKCVRTGDIETVGDLTHLTFFEMLGNFSFGDYFKAEAIQFSWEFMTSTEWLGIDPKRLTFTVFEEDDEAYDAWFDVLTKAGLDAKNRIFRLDEETNYWPAGAFSAGPPGPCGPNSEMFYWVNDEEPPPTGTYTKEDYLRDDSLGKWVEIWNDVFIQYEWQGHLANPERPDQGYVKDAMPELPFRSVDTGMGLERTALVLGGKKSIYDTDAFLPIIDILEQIANYKYGTDAAKDRAIRIISDHIRTACFCIADGILPSNNGRGYVLRRLIRRAVLKGLRALSLADVFFHLVYEGVVVAMGEHYLELIDRREVIIETLKNEEALFRRTIHSGSEMLSEAIERLQAANQKVLPGPQAFRLYDTFGFPLEVTVELCQEAGIEVDTDGYNESMKEAQDLSRRAGGMDTVYGGTEGTIFVTIVQQSSPTATHFVGYDQTEVEALIVAAVPETDETGATTGRFAVALDRTPFYAESGGQVSDVGTMSGPGFVLDVLDVIKQDGVFVHLAHPQSVNFPEPFVGMPADQLQEVLNARFFNHGVTAKVDSVRRERIIRNHTATHLLQAALRSVLGMHVTQAGSAVTPDHLRFDFTHGKAMTADEIAEVEAIVNENILKGNSVEIFNNVPIDQARAMGAMALFGEKYGDFVRVVDIREQQVPVSIELCGGCHVANTGQIGLFKIIHESSAASGIRRIEAVTGQGAIEYVAQLQNTVRKSAELLKGTPTDLVANIEKVLESLREERKKREKMAQQGGAQGAKVQNYGEFSLAIQTGTDLDPRESQLIVERLLDNNPKRIGLVIAADAGTIRFVCKAGKDAVAKGFHAGNFVKILATATGGGGGGKPDFATSGGKQPDKVDQALQDAEQHLKTVLA